MSGGAILGLGMDAVGLARFARRLESEAFRRRVFTPAEIASAERRANPVLPYALRFAAKEAAMKCLGAGIRQGLWFSQIEVEADRGGAPRLRLHRRAAEVARARGGGGWRLCLSATDAQAHALAILLAPDAAAAPTPQAAGAGTGRTGR
ncbi:holo-ACP synthase [Albimonas sp. CAU 1670]|uniref:holo-ACP synthase n=1 Tax=Albimonas sp. CAU 1670 TaxID=3032599 RepID=UPI0023DC52AC|nr:holo-ACP synthase [Albimonas sp. CAU 1670]MDF2235333.1 holo-ACP synthase [Albimonas sp. CAU 1670]